jgi:membrane protein DedA with SNARE-associated domain
MTPTIAWLSAFILSYPLLQYIIIFLGAGFGGEVAVISLSFLAAQNIFPIVPFFIVGFLGTMTADILWFLLGKTKTAGKIVDHRYATYTISVIMEAIRKVSRGNHLLAFIFAKFLVGTRVVVILYVSKTNISLKHFILNDLVAIFIWLTTLTSIGFLSGLGFAYISHILKNIYAGIGFVILILLIIVMVQIWLKKFFTKEGEEIIKGENL